MVQLFCVCRKPDTGSLMVGCDGCDDWFHFPCIGIDVKYEKLILKYFCKGCGDKVLWRRKCRLETCYRPIERRADAGEDDEDQFSKYCSEKHGLEYVAQYVDKVTSDKELQILQAMVENSQSEDGKTVDVEKFKSQIP